MGGLLSRLKCITYTPYGKMKNQSKRKTCRYIYYILVREPPVTGNSSWRLRAAPTSSWMAWLWCARSSTGGRRSHTLAA